jgi:hypothetical protein
MKLTLHPEKTREVELREGKEGFDFLGWHLHKRMSGKLWEEKRIRRYGRADRRQADCGWAGSSHTEPPIRAERWEPT